MSSTTKPDVGSVPATMRAWAYTQPGLPSTVLKLTNTHPVQHSLGPNEALVKISHCGFNAGVVLIVRLLPSWMHKTPAILELDLSGEIIATTSSRADLKPGTKVFGTSPPLSFFRYGRGTLAEYVVVPADTVMSTPKNMSLEQASGLSGCGCTAIQLIRQTKIKRGDSVFINGGSGGLGSILVQVIKATVGETGKVVVTCSGAKADFVKSLGADEIIDYTAYTSLSSHVARTYSGARFDAAIDTVGIQSLYTSSPSYLKTDGVFANVGGMTVSHTWADFLGFFWMILMNFVYPSFLPNGVPRKYAFLSGYANEKDLQALKQLVEDGKLRVPIDSTFEMEDALKAYERIESKRASGKIVVKVQDL